MFVEVRKDGSRRKYYLVHSYRYGGKVKKVRVYLGTDLTKEDLEKKKAISKEEITRRMKHYKEVRDPYKTILSPSEVKEVKRLSSKIKIKLIHLSEEEWLKFTEAFTYDTNAIEGSTVEKSEVENILEQNKWPDKSKDEISETIGVSEAIKYLRATKEHISIELIEDLHKMVFKNSKSFAGKFRKIGEEVAVVDSKGTVIHRGAFSGKVHSLLKELIEWYKESKDKYPPLVLAAVIHNQFESIHPFRDGNGRVGRLLLINILLKHKLPPLNIELKNRTEYYAALQSYQKEGNIRPTLELLLKEYRRLKTIIKR